jgi:hypothetical protein
MNYVLLARVRAFLNDWHFIERFSQASDFDIPSFAI